MGNRRKSRLERTRQLITSRTRDAYVFTDAGVEYIRQECLELGCADCGAEPGQDCAPGPREGWPCQARRTALAVLVAAEVHGADHEA